MKIEQEIKRFSVYELKSEEELYFDTYEVVNYIFPYRENLGLSLNEYSFIADILELSIEIGSESYIESMKLLRFFKNYNLNNITENKDYQKRLLNKMILITEVVSRELKNRFS